MSEVIISKYQILCSEGFHNYIKKTRTKGEKERLIKAINDIKNGDWEFGVRVKKLKGIVEPVFEARLDKALRILFQIKKISINSISNSVPVPSILLQTIVKHKHINVKGEQVSKINVENICLDVNDTRLIGPVVQEQKIKSISDLEEFTNKNKHLQKVFASNDTLSLVENIKLSPPSGERIYRFDKEDWEKWIKNGDTRLELALSTQQNELRYRRGPLLINGSAGTGKTTLLAYKFFDQWKKSNYKLTSLFVTYTQSLEEYILELTQNMSMDVEVESLQKQIVTIENLQRRLLGSKQEIYDPENKITLKEFLKWDRIRSKLFEDLDPIKVWEEIRSIIKGICYNDEQHLISIKKYFEVGSKRTIFQSEIEKKKVYEIARKYQIWLHEKSYWDEIDLSQATIQKLIEIQNTPYDISKNVEGVICDEIQDLTEVQYLMFFLIINKDHKFRSNLFFAGDTQQIIHPSRFRWEDMTASIYEYFELQNEKSISRSLISLNRNYRCAVDLIKLSNAFLEKRWELIKKKVGEELQLAIEDHDFKHIPAYLINDEENQILEMLKSVTINRKRMLVVNSKETQADLKDLLKTHFIHTVEETKGLEYDATLLINIATDTEIDWRKLLDKKNNDIYIQKNQHMITYSFNIMYVALTRARRHLAIFEKDPEANKFWQSLIGSYFEIEKVENLRSMWARPTSKEEYLSDAQYFFKLKKFLEAAESYKGAGIVKKEFESRARYYRQEKEYNKSTNLFLEVNMEKDAAKDFELIDPFQSLRLYKKLNDEKGQFRAKALIAEINHDYKEAGNFWGNAGDNYRSQKAYDKAGSAKDKSRAEARLHEQYKEWIEAANSHEDGKNWKKAGNNWKLAAEVYLNDGKTKDAIKYYTKSLKNYEKGKNFNEIAIVYQEFIKIRVLEKKFGEAAINAILAAENYQKDEKYQSAIDVLKTAVEHYDVINSPIDIAQSFIKMAENYTYIQNYLEVENVLIKAIKHFEDAGTKDDIANTKLKLTDLYHKQKRYTEEINNLEDAIKIFKEIESKNLAPTYEKLARVNIFIDKIENAIENLKLAGGSYEALLENPKAISIYEKIIELTEDNTLSLENPELWHHVSELCREQDLFEKAKYFLMKSIEIYSPQPQNVSKLAILYELAADISFELNDEDSMNTYLKEAFNHYSKIKNEYKIIEIGKNIITNVEYDDEDEKLSFSEELFKAALKFGDHDLIIETGQLSSELQENLGRYKDAIKTFKKLNRYSVDDEERITSISRGLARNYFLLNDRKNSFKIWKKVLEAYTDDNNQVVIDNTIFEIEELEQITIMYLDISEHSNAYIINEIRASIAFEDEEFETVANAWYSNYEIAKQGMIDSSNIKIQKALDELIKCYDKQENYEKIFEIQDIKIKELQIVSETKIERVTAFTEIIKVLDAKEEQIRNKLALTEEFNEEVELRKLLRKTIIQQAETYKAYNNPEKEIEKWKKVLSLSLNLKDSTKVKNNIMKVYEKILKKTSLSKIEKEKFVKELVTQYSDLGESKEKEDEDKSISLNRNIRYKNKIIKLLEKYKIHQEILVNNYYELGRLLEIKKEFENSYLFLEKAWNLLKRDDDPLDTKNLKKSRDLGHEIALKLSDISLQMDKFDVALNFISDSIKIVTYNDYEKKATSMDQRAKLYLEMGENERSITTRKEITKLYKKSEGTKATVMGKVWRENYYDLARLLEEEAKYKDALQYWEESENNDEINRCKAMIYENSNQFDKAMKAWKLVGFNNYFQFLHRYPQQSLWNLIKSKNYVIAKQMAMACEDDFANMIIDYELALREKMYYRAAILSLELGYSVSEITKKLTNKAFKDNNHLFVDDCDNNFSNIGDPQEIKRIKSIGFQSQDEYAQKYKDSGTLSIKEFEKFIKLGFPTKIEHDTAYLRSKCDDYDEFNLIWKKGFKTKLECEKAKSLGFSTKKEYQKIIALGFANKKEYNIVYQKGNWSSEKQFENGMKLNFKSQNEYDSAFKISNFEKKAAFQRSYELGFNTKEEYQIAFKNSGFNNFKEFSLYYPLGIDSVKKYQQFYSESGCLSDTEFNVILKKGYFKISKYKEIRGLGFITKTEYDRIITLGFQNKKEYLSITEKGFENKDEYVRISSLGIKTKDQYNSLYSKSGFKTEEDFEIYYKLKIYTKKQLMQIYRNSGFNIEDDFRKAMRKGFKTQKEYEKCVSLGFETKQEYINARNSSYCKKGNTFDKIWKFGFKTCKEYQDAYKKSGCKKIVRFDSLLKQNFRSLTAYNEAYHLSGCISKNEFKKVIEAGYQTLNEYNEFKKMDREKEREKGHTE